MTGKQNPRIREVEVGIRDLKKIKVFPLAIGDELAVSDLISETLTQFFSQKVDDINKKVIDFFIGTVTSNLLKVLDFITDEDNLKSAGYENGIKDLIKDLDNDQLVDMFEIVYKNNFERIVKNLKGSLRMILGMFAETEIPSREPLQGSATSTQDIDSNTSTHEDTKMEE